MKDRFPSQGGLTARLVFHTDAGRLDDSGHKATIGRTRQQLSAGKAVADVTDPFAAQSAAVTADGRTAYVDVAYSLDKLTITQFDDATAAATTARSGVCRPSSPVF